MPRHHLPPHLWSSCDLGGLITEVWLPWGSNSLFISGNQCCDPHTSGSKLFRQIRPIVCTESFLKKAPEILEYRRILFKYLGSWSGWMYVMLRIFLKSDPLSHKHRGTVGTVLWFSIKKIYKIYVCSLKGSVSQDFRPRIRKYFSPSIRGLGGFESWKKKLGRKSRDN